MSDKIIYCNNAMLNLPGFNSTAATSIKLELGSSHDFGSKGKESHSQLTGSLCISDCNRVIELDCYANTKEEYDNVIHKLKTLATITREALANLQVRQSNFNAQYDRVEARIKQEQEDRKDE